ncbi:Xaa-Pro aminopeptidase [Piscinibacter sakaiensis]|uniref:Xaa-Pro aminopeptidase n=1 Tax=Piscinibacter sakaiensis TaxID=1547922 RepID=A0A0K8NVY6_PISS1|nr:Xaa-Pro aminopeptidase [Piscinibacter sakaiensis]
MRDGQLVLIDAGCELDGYASDITRNFPANGRFSGPQRALYDLGGRSCGVPRHRHPHRGRRHRQRQRLRADHARRAGEGGRDRGADALARAPRPVHRRRSGGAPPAASQLGLQHFHCIGHSGTCASSLALSRWDARMTS